MPRFALILALSLMAQAAAAQIAERDLRDLSPDSPVSGTLALTMLTPVDDRLQIRLEARMPQLFDEIDSQMGARRNLGNCQARLRWKGPTRLRSADETLRIRTRFSGELRICSSILKTTIVKGTHRADLSLHPQWDVERQRLFINVRIDDIYDIPDALENILQDKGVPFSHQLEVRLGDRDALRQLDPKFESIRFDPNGRRGVTLSIVLSADREAVFNKLRSELGLSLTDILGNRASGFGHWLFGPPVRPD